MDLQNLKRWHWVIIGLVVGFGLSFVYDRWDRSAQAPTIGIRTLQEHLLREARRVEGDPPMIRNLRLHPPIVNERGQSEWLMTFDYLDLRRGAYSRAQTVASEPFRVESVNNTEFSRNQELPNIRVYLDGVKAANEGLDYRYLWWQETNWAYILWTGGAVVLIGGIWPTLLNLLVGAGFGRPPQEAKKDEYDLSRFGKGQPEPAVEVAAPAVDPEELEAVTRAYEERIGDESIEESISEAPSDPADTPAPVRQLKSGPDAEGIAPIRSQEEEEKEFTGEFYPVAKATHKKPKE